MDPTLLKFDSSGSRLKVFSDPDLDFKWDRGDFDDLVAHFVAQDITNVNEGAVIEALKKKTGEYEDVGEAFRVFDRNKAQFVDLSIEQLFASFTFRHSKPVDIDITQDDIMFLLKEAGVRTGFRLEVIRNIAETQAAAKVIVAEGIPPVRGENARVEEIMKVDSEETPQMMEDGRMDYKSLDNLSTVKKDELIAVKHPPGEGVDGLSVLGEVLEAKPGSNTILPAGENTYLSGDGSRMYAGEAGYLFRTKYTINVGLILDIKGDVDFSVGHIKHNANVIIRGNVNSGFKVEADGDILIMGVVENAEVWSRGGDVEIRNGVFGKGNCTIYAKKNMRIEFAQDAKLRADGRIFFNRYLMNCNTFAQEAVQSRSPESFILGGNTQSFNLIRTWKAGNDSETKTRLSIKSPDTDDFDEQLLNYKGLENRLHTSLASVSKKLKDANKKLVLKQKKQNNLKEEIKKMIAEYQGLLIKLKVIQKKILGIELERKKSKVFKGTVEVSGEIFPKTEIFFGEEVRENTEHRTGIKFFYDEKIREEFLLKER